MSAAAEKKMRKGVFFRKRQLTRRGKRGIIFCVPSEWGGMAQSVEHIVHIDGVVGSSPTVTTTVQSVEDWTFLYIICEKGGCMVENLMFCRRKQSGGMKCVLKDNNLIRRMYL